MHNLFIPLLQIVQPTDSIAQQLDEFGNVIPAEETISIIQLIADGGWYIMGPLFVMSILAVYLFVERYMAIKKASTFEADFSHKIRDYIFEGKIDAAKHLCETSDTPMSRIVAKGIASIGKPMKDINSSIENVAKLEVYNLERGLSKIATIAGAAPMIGFLGTVIGMMATFHEMKISGNGVEIANLSGGIMQAMVTTVAGLVVGIIAYIAYNTLVSSVDKVVNHMEMAAIEFMDVLDEPGK
jgi:biopolymer transport protein ExbB